MKVNDFYKALKRFWVTEKIPEEEVKILPLFEDNHKEKTYRTKAELKDAQITKNIFKNIRKEQVND